MIEIIVFLAFIFLARESANILFYFIKLSRIKDQNTCGYYSGLHLQGKVLVPRLLANRTSFEAESKLFFIHCLRFRCFKSSNYHLLHLFIVISFQGHSTNF